MGGVGARLAALHLVVLSVACGRIDYGPIEGGLGTDAATMDASDASDVMDAVTADVGTDAMASDGGETDSAVGDASSCSGCSLGAECLPGTDPSACGSGGGPCMVCAPTAICGEGSCTTPDRHDLLGLGFGWSCAARGGSGYCWGGNFSGELGDGTTTNRPMPGLVSGLTGVAGVAASDTATCALTTDGAVSCWGSRTYGSFPVSIAALTDAVSLSGGETHFCALRTGGVVSCWGDNFDGRLGDGTTTSSPSPVNVAGLPGAADQVTAGFSHSCARVGGQVYCWGSNTFGQLGDSTMAPSLTPVTVTGLGDAVDIAAGYRHTCAARASGPVVCWGANFAPSPVTVPMSDGVTRLRAGYDYTCGIRSGSVLCWGINGLGQLGDGTTTARSEATTVAAIGGVLEVETGNQHTCARTSALEVWCWGDNSGGELGDGSTVESHVPVLVAFP